MSRLTHVQMGSCGGRCVFPTSLYYYTLDSLLASGRWFWAVFRVSRHHSDRSIFHTDQNSSSDFFFRFLPGEIVRTETANGILDNVSEQSSNGEDNCKGHDELVLVNGDVKAYGDVSNEAPGIVGTDGRNTIPYLTHRGKPKLCQRWRLEQLNKQ